MKSGGWIDGDPRRSTVIATATREIGRKRDLLTVGPSWRRVISGSRDWVAGFRRLEIYDRNVNFSKMRWMSFNVVSRMNRSICDVFFFFFSWERVNNSWALSWKSYVTIVTIVFFSWCCCFKETGDSIFFQKYRSGNEAKRNNGYKWSGSSNSNRGNNK